jgi:hypothetical protein
MEIPFFVERIRNFLVGLDESSARRLAAAVISLRNYNTVDHPYPLWINTATQPT